MLMTDGYDVVGLSPEICIQVRHVQVGGKLYCEITISVISQYNCYVSNSMLRWGYCACDVIGLIESSDPYDITKEWSDTKV